jgi:hypothetical protein
VMNLERSEETRPRHGCGRPECCTAANDQGLLEHCLSMDQPRLLSVEQLMEKPLCRLSMENIIITQMLRRCWLRLVGASLVPPYFNGVMRL